MRIKTSRNNQLMVTMMLSNITLEERKTERTNERKKERNSNHMFECSATIGIVLLDSLLLQKLDLFERLAYV